MLLQSPCIQVYGYYSPLKLLVALVFALLQNLSTCADFLPSQAVIQGDILLWWKGAIFVPAKMKVFWEPKLRAVSPPLLVQILWSTNGLMKPPGYCSHCSGHAFTVLASRTQCSPCSRILLQRSLWKIIAGRVDYRLFYWLGLRLGD